MESNAKLIGIVNPDQSRDEYFEKLYQAFNEYVGTPYPEKEQEAQESILAMTYDRIKELERQLSFYADKNQNQ